jgi:hypothetical protein
MHLGAPGVPPTHSPLLREGSLVLSRNHSRSIPIIRISKSDKKYLEISHKWLYSISNWFDHLPVSYREARDYENSKIVYLNFGSIRHSLIGAIFFSCINLGGEHDYFIGSHTT